MSKTQLNKMLARMTAEQIAELVTELYDARPEAKEYLEFYMKPDIDAKLDKAKAAIRKEVGRSSRGRSRMRSTKLRRIIKDIASFNPGLEPVMDISAYTIEAICKASDDLFIKETTMRAVAKLTMETLQQADAGGVLDLVLPRVQKAVERMKSSWIHPNRLKQLLEESIADAL